MVYKFINPLTIIHRPGLVVIIVDLQTIINHMIFQTFSNYHCVVNHHWFINPFTSAKKETQTTQWWLKRPSDD